MPSCNYSSSNYQVPRHIKEWRTQRELRYLYPDQLKQSQAGHRLLKMQRARQDAFRPVWITAACWALSKALPTWTTQAVASFALSLLAHPGLLASAAALVIALQVPEAPTTKALKHLGARVLSLFQFRILRESSSSALVSRASSFCHLNPIQHPQSLPGSMS
jgi:hypothetical protein